jgi:hypothetical protein
MTGTCETCMFWMRNDSGLVIFRHDYFMCWHKSSDDEPHHFPDTSIVLHPEDTTAGIYTGPRFGCVHWQAKDEDGATER